MKRAPHALVALLGAAALVCPSWVEAGCPFAGKHGDLALGEPLPEGLPHSHRSGSSSRRLQNGEGFMNEPADAPEEQMELPEEYAPKGKYCFNARHYPLSEMDPKAFDYEGLYKDYERIFDWGWANQMGYPMQAYSSSSGMTQNRIANFCIRQAFHDAASVEDPNTYALGSVERQFYFKNFGHQVDECLEWKEDGYHVWNGQQPSAFRPPCSKVLSEYGNHEFLISSSQDGSTLLHPWERVHENQDYDNHATRLVRAFNSKILQPFSSESCSWDTNIAPPSPAVEDSANVSLMEKYDMSYADALHNCAAAAQRWLSNGRFDTATEEYMHFGRRDACYYKNDVADKSGCGELGCGEPKLLAGMTWKLPSTLFHGTEFNSWFARRGCGPHCAMGLMASHSLLDDNALVHGLDEVRTWSTQYFRDLSLGSHTLKEDMVFPGSIPEGTGESLLLTGPQKIVRKLGVGAESLSGCSWHPYSSDQEVKWPVTHNDCAMSLDNLEYEFETRIKPHFAGAFHEHALGEMANVIKEFSNNYDTMTKYFRCAMLKLGGATCPEADDPYYKMRSPLLFGSYAPASSRVDYSVPHECRKYECNSSCPAVPAWGQASGPGFGMGHCCVSGYKNSPVNKWYGQCIPDQTEKDCDTQTLTSKGLQGVHVGRAGPLLDLMKVSFRRGPMSVKEQELLAKTYRLMDYAECYHPFNVHASDCAQVLAAAEEDGLYFHQLPVIGAGRLEDLGALALAKMDGIQVQQEASILLTEAPIPIVGAIVPRDPEAPAAGAAPTPPPPPQEDVPAVVTPQNGGGVTEQAIVHSPGTDPQVGTVTVGGLTVPISQVACDEGSAYSPESDPLSAKTEYERINNLFPTGPTGLCAARVDGYPSSGTRPGLFATPMFGYNPDGVTENPNWNAHDLPITRTVFDQEGRPTDIFEVMTVERHALDLFSGSNGAPDLCRPVGYQGTTFSMYMSQSVPAFSPGPTIKLCKGRQAMVRFENFAGDPIGVHMHGAGSVPAYDGWADDATPNGWAKNYIYPGNRATTLWYHDHVTHMTADNAYHGLAAQHIVKDCDDPLENDYWPLEKHSIPMVVRDGVLDTALTGEGLMELVYYGGHKNTSGRDEHKDFLFGDINLTNGIAWPRLTVDRLTYRLRFLNASISRQYHYKFLAVSQSGKRQAWVPMYLLQADGGGVHENIKMYSLFNAVAERYTVAVNFNPMAASFPLQDSSDPWVSVYLVNDFGPTGGQPPFFCKTHLLARFDLGSEVAATQGIDQELLTSSPAVLQNGQAKPFAALRNLVSEADVVRALERARNGEFDRQFDFGRSGGRWVVNGCTWDNLACRIIANPKRNSLELWKMKGHGGWTHPIHIHLIDFIVLHRDGGNELYEDYDALDPAGGAGLFNTLGLADGLRPWEKDAPKDVVHLGESQDTYVLIRFGPHDGDFMMHCHNLVHEDNDMMVAFGIGRVSAAAGEDTSDQADTMFNTQPADVPPNSGKNWKSGAYEVDALGNSLSPATPEVQGSIDYQLRSALGDTAVIRDSDQRYWLCPKPDPFATNADVISLDAQGKCGYPKTEYACERACRGIYDVYYPDVDLIPQHMTLREDYMTTSNPIFENIWAIDWTYSRNQLHPIQSIEPLSGTATSAQPKAMEDFVRLATAEEIAGAYSLLTDDLNESPYCDCGSYTHDLTMRPNTLPQRHLRGN